jgi:hypothetical protein
MHANVPSVWALGKPIKMAMVCTLHVSYASMVQIPGHATCPGLERRTGPMAPTAAGGKRLWLFPDELAPPVAGIALQHVGRPEGQ